jgi:hypothetical protein
MQHKTIRGKIRYTYPGVGGEPIERGREWFTITRHSDGSRTLRAQCEIESGHPFNTETTSVLRDVTFTVDEHRAPKDAFVRLTVGDQFTGSSWFLFGAHETTCEGFTKAEGRFSQKIEKRARAFGCHPIAADGWLMSNYPLPKGEGRHTVHDLMLSSPDHRGATGPMIFPTQVGLEFVKRETVEVEAGTFDALHFRVVDTKGNLLLEHPPYDVWVSDDGEFIALKAVVGTEPPANYELVAIERDDQEDGEE